MTPVSPCPHAATIARIEDDMYYTRLGKGPLTVRVQTLESDMGRSEEIQKATDKKFWAIIILLITTLTGIIVDIATKHT